MNQTQSEKKKRGRPRKPRDTDRSQFVEERSKHKDNATDPNLDPQSRAEQVRPPQAARQGGPRDS